MENAHDAGADVHASAKILAKQLDIESDKEFNEVCELTAPAPDKRVGFSNKIIYKDGDWVFNFGKHRGEKLVDNISYINWMLGANFDRETTHFLQQFLMDPKSNGN